jgi:hypothetical protein
MEVACVDRRRSWRGTQQFHPWSSCWGRRTTAVRHTSRYVVIPVSVQKSSYFSLYMQCRVLRSGYVFQMVERFPNYYFTTIGFLCVSVEGEGRIERISLQKRKPIFCCRRIFVSPHARMIYPGPGFLAVVWFGSCPTPSPLFFRQQILSFSQSSCVSPVEALTDGREKEGMGEKCETGRFESWTFCILVVLNRERLVAWKFGNWTV